MAGSGGPSPAVGPAVLSASSSRLSKTATSTMDGGSFGAKLFGIRIRGLTRIMKYVTRFFTVSQAIKGCYIMALSLSVHYIGYECARAASISLLSNKGAGLDSIGIPLTVVVGFPVSALTLYLYTLSIRHYGAKFTYRVSNFICCFVLGAMSVLIPMNILSGFTRKAVIIMFYSFREIYVTLISTQQWSFIVSALNKTNSWLIVSIGGVVSVASTVGGFAVEQIVRRLGVYGLIMVATGCMMVSALLSELAFSTYCVSVANEALNKLSGKGSKAATSTGNLLASSTSTNSVQSSQSVDRLECESIKSTSTNSLYSEADDSRSQNGDNSKESHSGPPKNSVWRSSWQLITQHETLRLLFAEAIVHQFCSNTLNLMFLDGLRVGVVDDDYRAVVVGRFFACVNCCACILQIFVVPHMLTQQTLPAIICSVPIIVGMTAIVVTIYPRLLTVMFCFGTLKILEYAGGCTGVVIMLRCEIVNECLYIL
jgi:hypothetical protein